MWIPLLLSIITPCMLTVNAMTIKYLCKNNGFNSTRTTMNGLMSFNFIILFFISIPYWNKHEFFHDLFWMGLFGGFINAGALMWLNKAFTSGGPAGPVTAITAMSSALLVVIMAIIDHKMISLLELIACIFGMYGTLIISLPNYFEKYCFCLCCEGNKKN